MGDIFKRGNFDYIQPGNPTVNINPKVSPATWLNVTTGEVFVCIDPAVGGNVWIGQKNYRVMPFSGPIALPVVNPDASLDLSIGWINEVGTLKRRTLSGAPSGGYYFYSTDSETRARQTINLEDYRYFIEFSSIKLELQYWYNGYSGDDDSSQIGVRFRDSMMNVIGSEIWSPLVETDGGPWLQIPALEAAIPAETRNLDILIGMNRTGGVDNNAYMDDITANLVEQ
jgi:hypothetical protein